MVRCKALALLLCAGPLLFAGVKRPALRAVEEEQKLDPVAGSGELPEWLMEATGGVPTERPSSGVDFSWDYRVVGAVIFALGLLYVGFQG